MPVTTRNLLIAAALLSLTACGNTELTARGSVIASYEGIDTGLRFEDTTRLEAPMRDGTLSLVTGRCEMARVADDTWGVVVDLNRGSTVDDNGLSSVTIMQRSDADPTMATVEADIDMRAFSSGSGTCSVELDYAVPDSGMVGLTGTCAVQDAEGDEASIAIELDVTGCTVIE